MPPETKPEDILARLHNAVRVKVIVASKEHKNESVLTVKKAQWHIYDGRSSCVVKLVVALTSDNLNLILSPDI